MRQTQMHLTEKDRSVIDEIRSKGVHRAREVNRAHGLSSVDQGIAEVQITAVLAIGRAAVWRIRAAYLQRACNGRCSTWPAGAVRGATTRPPRHG